MADAGDFDFHQLLFGQVVERTNDPLPIGVEGASRAGKIDFEPDFFLLRLLQNAPQKLAAFAVKTAEHFERGDERLELIIGVKRRAAGEIAVEFEIGEQGAGDEHPNVVRIGKLVLADVELDAERKNFVRE